MKLKSNKNEVQEAVETGLVPTAEEPKQQSFKDIIILAPKTEALAMKAIRGKDFIPEDFEKTGGRLRAVPVTAGFDRSILAGNRIVGFTLGVNLVAKAVDGVEIPIRDLNARARMESATRLTPEGHQAAVEEALLKAATIPATKFTASEVVANPDDVMEVVDL